MDWTLFVKGYATVKIPSSTE
jgi:hypothetical protein